MIPTRAQGLAKKNLTGSGSKAGSKFVVFALFLPDLDTVFRFPST